jgi:hypothetical protein
VKWFWCVREESVMRESVSPLLQCAGVGGAHMRARAVCVHAALKLSARLLLQCEARRDKSAALEVTTQTLWLYISIIYYKSEVTQNNKT